MEQVVQIMKSHSASKVFKKMPNFIKRYPRKAFLGRPTDRDERGLVGENIIRNYIRRKDVSYEPFLQHKEDAHQKNCNSTESSAPNTIHVDRRWSARAWGS